MYQQEQNELNVIRVTIEQLNKQKSGIENTIAQLSEYHAKQTALHNELKTSLEQEQLNLTALNHIIAQGLTEHPSHLTQRTIAQQLEQALTALAYDEKKHTEYRKKLQDIEQTLMKYDGIKKEITLQDQRYEIVKTLCATLKELRRTLKELNEKRAAYASLAQQEAALLNTKNALAQEMRTIQQEKEAGLHKKGSLENQAGMLKQNETQHTERIKNNERTQRKCLGLSSNRGSNE